MQGTGCLCLPESHNYAKLSQLIAHGLHTGSHEILLVPLKMTQLLLRGRGCREKDDDWRPKEHEESENLSSRICSIWVGCV